MSPINRVFTVTMLFLLLASGLALPQSPSACVIAPNCSLPGQQNRKADKQIFSKQMQTDLLQKIRYEPDESNFLNPERGFHKNTELLKAGDLHWVRAQGYTLVRAYVRLDDFRDRPLTQESLDKLRDGFASVRAAGIKVLPIFAYNFPTDEDIKADRVKNSPDAPLPLVLQHLQQLKPILTANQDIIAALEIGFVGAWGEWHSSRNGLDSPENKKAILQAILRALPKSRMMQLRYPGDLMNIYPMPLNTRQAYAGSDQARTGWANMCFLSNASDSGTYMPLDTKAEKQKYLEQMTRYVVVGGETCQITPEQNRTDCLTALPEFARFHFSYLNLDFYPPTIEKWRQDGCLETIAKRLGYRLRLEEASVSRQAKAGKVLSVRLTLVNEGWAAPYNPRRVELILRSKMDGHLLRFPLSVDPRRWQPDAGPATIMASLPLPKEAPAGEYELLLNLPDPMPALAARPEYAIRLANRDVWEPTTGFNRLQAEVTVTH